MARNTSSFVDPRCATMRKPSPAAVWSSDAAFSSFSNTLSFSYCERNASMTNAMKTLKTMRMPTM